MEVQDNITANPEMHIRKVEDILMAQSKYLFVRILPIFLFIGFVGNPISFFVWMSRKLRRNNSSACYMGVLALNDFINNVLSLIYYLSLDFNLINYQVICQLFNQFYLCVQYNSLILVFAFSLERWIAVCYPFKREKFCSEQRAWYACGIIILTILCITSPYLYIYKMEASNCVFRNFENSTLNQFYISSTEIVLSLIFPLLTLIFNILVILEMYKITRSHFAMEPSLGTMQSLETKGNFNPNQRKSMDSVELSASKENKITANPSTSQNTAFKSTTTTLLFVSFFNILTTVPASALYVIQGYYEEGDKSMTANEMLNDKTWQKHFHFQNLKKNVDIFGISHFCLNILIYLSSSNQFRSQLRHMCQDLVFCCLRPRHRSDLLTNSLNNSATKTRCNQSNNTLNVNIKMNNKQSRSLLMSNKNSLTKAPM